jgi:hypothetical protein
MQRQSDIGAPFSPADAFTTNLQTQLMNTYSHPTIHAVQTMNCDGATSTSDTKLKLHHSHIENGRKQLLQLTITEIIIKLDRTIKCAGNEFAYGMMNAQKMFGCIQ